MSTPTKKQNGPRYASSYARKSNKHQQALREQHLINIAEAAKDGFTIPDHLCFEDNDTPGETTSRDGLDTLMAIVEQGDPPFERVYVVVKDRLGRFGDVAYHDWVRIQLGRFGVVLRYSREPNIDFSKGMSTPENRAAALDDRVTSITANSELHTLSRRVRTGIRDRVKRRFYPGAVAPYATVRWLADYDSHALIREVPDGFHIRGPNTAFVLRWKTDGSPQVIREIFDMVDTQDLPLQQIAAALKARKIPAPDRGTRRTSGRAGNCDWSVKTVRYLLTNTIYQGDLIWGDQNSDLPPIEPAPDQVVDGPAPLLMKDFLADPPISREQFARVQERLRMRAESYGESRHSNPEFLLSSRLRCAVCGTPWHGHTAPGPGTSRRYYRHGTNSKDATPGGTRTVVCTSAKRYVHAYELERQIVELVILRIFSDDVQRDVLTELQRQAQNNSFDPQKLAEKDEQIANARGYLQNAALDKSMAGDNRLLADAFQKAIDQHHGTIATLTLEREALVGAKQRAEAAARNLDIAVVTAKRLIAGFADAPRKRQKAIIRQLVAMIELDPDSGLVTVEILLGAASPRSDAASAGKMKKKKEG